jgi:hypothetical protein
MHRLLHLPGISGNELKDVVDSAHDAVELAKSDVGLSFFHCEVSLYTVIACTAVNIEGAVHRHGGSIAKSRPTNVPANIAQPATAVNNIHSVQYYALDVYASDVLIPGKGCLGDVSPTQRISSPSCAQCRSWIRFSARALPHSPAGEHQCFG